MTGPVRDMGGHQQSISVAHACRKGKGPTARVESVFSYLIPLVDWSQLIPPYRFAP